MPSTKNALLLLSLLISCAKPGDTKSNELQPVTVAKQPAPEWWQPLLPDSYIGELNSDQKKEFDFVTNELLCPCGDHSTVFAACIEERLCPEALQAANMTARLLRQNVPRSTAETLVIESFGGAPVELSVQDAPILGDMNAPITLVAFADFQCPHCAKLALELHEIVKSRPKDVRLVYKYYPIPSHAHAYLAAEAAAFAQTYNKFWELHDILFERQKQMSREEILKWATEVGLDAKALEVAWQEKIYLEKVKRDEDEGDKLKIRGTPTLFINGRIYNEPMHFVAISRVIDEALMAKKAGKKK